MLSKRQKRVVIGVAALVAFVLFVVPFITISKYKASVAQTLSQTLGREVTIGDISIQTFPQPGLLMNNVVIGDDPTISAEPMLRADQVLATLRISSLWRGRLEIGTLKLKYPSVNLVRANDGRWNLESLLERARETPSAPTAKIRPESRPRFPYIEADSGRINLKLGNEKKVFALNDADFAVWLESEDEWHMRLEARPIRTDANLSDTGTLKMHGSWRRAAQLHETPLRIDLNWDYGQLGQVSHLIYGRDRGWRGAVHLAAHVSGRPEHLTIRFDANIDDFRRYDIVSGESVSLEAHCNSEYNFTAKRIGNIACQIPAGSGVVLANGSYAFLPRPTVDLNVTAENVPMQYLALLARHAKRDLPSDMNLTGMMSAVFTVKGEYGKRLWAGNGEVSDIEVRSSVLSRPLRIEPSRWSLVGPGAEMPFAARREHSPRHPKLKDETPAPAGLAWKLDPVTVKLGAEAPATLSGWISRDGYFAGLRGEAELPRLMELATLAGLPKPTPELTGTAKGSVELSGAWTGFMPATITGDASLRDVTAKFAGIASPLRIAAGRFSATEDAFSVDTSSGSFAGLHTPLDFAAYWPQHCISAGPNDCALHFKVAAASLDVEEVNALLNPRAQRRPWYAALIGTPEAKFPDIYATGQIAAAKVTAKSLTLTHFASKLSLFPDGFVLSGINANVFGGSSAGELTADFSSRAPLYRLTGHIDKAAAAALASLMKDSTASGLANLKFDGEARGWTAGELASTASGNLTFTWLNGSLNTVALEPGGKPLHFRGFSGALALRDGVFRLSESKLQAPDGIYSVSGTASMDRKLELRLTRDGAPSYSIRGTLERPVVTPIPPAPTQAKLAGSGNR